MVRRRVVRYSFKSLGLCLRMYENSSSGSMLRKFCIDLIVWSPITFKGVLENPHLFSSEMFKDLWLAERDRRVNAPQQNPNILHE